MSAQEELPVIVLDGRSFEGLAGFLDARHRRIRRHEGQTLFDIIIEIIKAHGPGGAEAEDNVHLVLA